MQLSKLMEISLCSHLLTMPILFVPNHSPLPPSYSLPSYRQTLHEIPLSSFSPAPSLHCWSCPNLSFVHPLWHNAEQKCRFVWSQRIMFPIYNTKPGRASWHEVMATRAVVSASSHVTLYQHDLVTREPSMTQCSTYYNIGKQNALQYYHKKRRS